MATQDEPTAAKSAPTSERLEELQNLVELFPQDPFPRYGLAMELRSLGRADDAKRAFDELHSRFPDYVPQYLMYGQLLIELSEQTAAKQVLKAGIEKAQLARNTHALGELQSALNAIDDHVDDD